KNFVAKHIVESLYRRGYQSQYVQLYVVSRDFMHNDTEHIIQYKNRLTKDIEDKTRACQQAIFIFDEIDHMPNQLLDVILYYIDFHTPTRSQPIDFRKTIFIFLSNTGGASITELANKNHLSSIKREDYDISEFEKILSTTSYNEQGGLRQASILDRYLVTFFVPFLPLEREHIRNCIERQLEINLENDDFEYELSKNDIINRVMNLIEFSTSSSSSLEYSVSGYAMSGKQQQIDTLNSEIQILQKKLDSKTKAFAILINELETLKHERDQFKSLADGLQEKSVQLKRQLNNKNDTLIPFHHSTAVYEHPNDNENNLFKESEPTIQLLKSALKNVQDEKELLQTKIDELTRELNDVKGDLMIFRQKRHRARNNSNQNTTDDNSNSSNKETNDQQNILLKHLEQANERINQLDNDLKLIVCQKEELEIERDSFKTKYSKLNQELNKMLNGNEKHVIDIEHILSENRYLKVKMNELVQEKNYALANASKYKDLLQTHRSAYNRLGKVQSSGTVLTHKQVQNLLKQSYLVPASPEIDNDLRSIAEALYENLKDKNVTITHQRKTNKVLASRVAELEKLLAETSFSSKSDQTNTLINLLDRTPTPPILDSATSQFINSLDDQQQQISPTQIFSFSSSWATSPPLSNRVSDEDITNKIKGIKHHTPTLIKSTLECHQSRKIRNKSDSVELEMDDPLQSPTLTTSLAYLEETDLIPPPNRTVSLTEHLTSNLDDDDHGASGDEIEHLHNLLSTVTSSLSDKNNDRSQSTSVTNSNSTAANLTC
ncbi:unnamed protein product, partial [Adineta steineri]